MEKDGKFNVVEWTIQNFSCWNKEIHDILICSPDSYYYATLYLKLFPRGPSGRGEHVMVYVNHSKRCTIYGDLSFFDSDGSLICTIQVNSEMSEDELPPGPKFEDVVRKNEALRKDQLTLRLQWGVGSKMEYMRTSIDVFDVSCKISSKMLGKALGLIKYPLDEGKTGGLVLSIYKGQPDVSKIELALQPHYPGEKILVLTRTTVLTIEDAVVRTEDNEHVFHGREDCWTFSDSLAEEEVAKEGFSMILQFKIIRSNEHKECFGFYWMHPEEIVMMPPNRYQPPQGAQSFKNKTAVTSNQLNDSVTVLMKELNCLYEDQLLSDFQLKCGDVSFPVHKNILSARSPVFKTMLSTGMKKAAPKVDIGDVDPSTLGLFLTYLYTGAVEELQHDSTLKLYYAADKYQVPSLKRECVDFLSAKICVSTVCDILYLADRYKDEELTDIAHNFILKNYNEVLRSEKWKSFMEKDSLLAVKTVTHFAEQNQVGGINSP